MTTPPPLPDYGPASPTRTSRVGTVVAWVVILACVTYIVAQTPLRKAGAQQARLARPDGPPSFQLRLIGRYAVGLRPLMSSLGLKDAGSAATPLLPQVDAAATSSAQDRLRAAIVAGEVGGTTAALSRLDWAAPAGQSPDEDALWTVYTSGPTALTDEQRAALVERHEWFGQLALAHGLPSDDPRRREVLRPAVRTAATMLLATGLALAALFAGIIVLVVGMVRYADGRLIPAYRPPRRAAGPFLEAFAAYLAGMVALSALIGLLARRSLGSTWFLVAILPVAFFWPLARGIGRAELREGLGWHRGRGAWREAGAGLLGYLAALPVMAVGMVVTAILQKVSRADTAHPIVDAVGRGGAWGAVQLFLLAAVWAPLVEETMFRGAFYHHLRARLPWPAAAAVVGLIFAAIHPQGWAAVPVLGAIGFAFAALREWRGSVIAPTVAHAINNGAVTLLLLAMLA